MKDVVDITQLSLPQIVLASCTAGCLAEVATLPLDTAKVRCQLYPEKYTGLMQCIKEVIKSEGVPTLYNGLTSGLVRQSIYGTGRLALYDVFK